jgi:polyketide cyclase/dehydrase/lipid transport protein
MAAVTANRIAMFHVEASAVIDAPPASVHAIIADYKGSHPAILPKQFTSLIVEQGGHGAGTTVSVEMKVWGQTIRFRQVVTEPEPGHTIVETNPETGQYTTFIFDPVDAGRQTRLTISSEFPTKPGFAGWLEKTTQPMVIRPMYEQELRNIAEYARHNAKG